MVILDLKSLKYHQNLIKRPQKKLKSGIIYVVFSGGSHIGLHNIANPWGAHLAIHLKMINIRAKFDAFVRI